jgi:hypothetical protein
VKRVAIALILVLLAAAAAHDLTKLRSTVPSWETMGDLVAFDCGGAAVWERGNPYLASELRSCEHGVNSGGLWNDPRYVLPAPLPPYDFAGYALLSRLRYLVAEIAVAAGIVLALIVTSFALADLGVPPWAGAAALVLSDGVLGLILGQIVPFAIMFVAIAAGALHRKHDAAAGLCAALALIEPQIGIPACVVLFIFAARTRLAILVTACAMALLGVALVGTRPFLQWGTQVIPAQAHAEAASYTQYSLTSVLTSTGIPDQAALVAGTLSTLAMLLLGIWLAPRIAQRLGRREFLVLVPAAFAVIGGTYVHLVEIAAALPLALVFAFALPPQSRVRWLALAALILLAIPWIREQEWKPLFYACAFVTLVILLNLRTSTRATVAMLAVTALSLWLIALHTPPPLEQVRSVPAAAGQIASNWSLVTDFDPIREVGKLPTWLGLLALLYVSIASSFDRKRKPA